MTNPIWQDLLLIQTEAFLAVAIMTLLMIGAFAGNNSSRLISYLSVLTLAVTAGLLTSIQPQYISAFGGLYIQNGFIEFIKILVLLGGIVGIFFSISYFEREAIWRFEYPILILFSVLGMMVMLSAGNLMSLYIGLELQSLALYVLAAFKRDTIKSSEAGLKYFILGALASGMILYGSSLIYGASGSLSLHDIAATIYQSKDLSLLMMTGLVFVTAGLAFKISAVPFHMWTPDVYEGAPTPVTAYFAIVPKAASMGLIISLYAIYFRGAFDALQQIFIFMAAASMILGAFAAIVQTNIKRLLAYSSIGHMGYALIGMVVGTPDAMQAMIVYLIIYMIMSVAVFGMLLSIRKNDVLIESIDDLAGLSKSEPFMGAIFAGLMFSMAGIPPLAGFISKLLIFNEAVSEGFYILAIIGVLSSVVAAFYYLRIVKVIYFDEAGTEEPKIKFCSSVKLITAAASVVTLFLIAYPAPVLEVAQTAILGLYH